MWQKWCCLLMASTDGGYVIWFVPLLMLFLLLPWWRQCLPGFVITTFIFFSPLMLTNEHFVGRYSANILFLIEVQVINLLVYVSMGLWFPISVWCSNWPRFRQGELLQTGFHIFFIFSNKLGGFPCFLAQQDAPCSSCFLIQERIPVISLF